jgi:hypothetical protein
VDYDDNLSRNCQSRNIFLFNPGTNHCFVYGNFFFMFQPRKSEQHCHRIIVRIPTGHIRLYGTVPFVSSMSCENTTFHRRVVKVMSNSEPCILKQSTCHFSIASALRALSPSSCCCCHALCLSPSLRCRNPVPRCMDVLIIPDVSYPHLSEAILLVEIVLHLHRTHHLFSKLPCFALSHQELLPTILHCSILRTHAGRMPADFMPSPLIVRTGVHVCLHTVSFHCSAECVSILCERDFETPFIETTCARRTSSRVTHPYVSIVRYRCNLEVPGRHICLSRCSSLCNREIYLSLCNMPVPGCLSPRMFVCVYAFTVPKILGITGLRVLAPCVISKSEISYCLCVPLFSAEKNGCVCFCLSATHDCLCLLPTQNNTLFRSKQHTVPSYFRTVLPSPAGPRLLRLFSLVPTSATVCCLSLLFLFLSCFCLCICIYCS